jgi:aminopeptidase N
MVSAAVAALLVPAAAFAAPRQVLPAEVVPQHYDLHIIPDAKALRFNGEESVRLAVAKATAQVVLNAKGLSFDKVSIDGKPVKAITLDAKLEQATFTVAAPLTAGTHTLSISYHAPIKTGSTLGFFAMDYGPADAKKRTLATNFEPASAREFLPSWDEPGDKASFTVSVDAPSDEMAVANMPAAKTEALGGGLTRTTFVETPKMSSYLLFLTVGDYERVHRSVDGVDVGVVVKRGDTPRAAYALEQAVKILPYYNSYFGTPFPLPKLDLIAAPGNIDGGSMENWGANFYSQEHLLYDPKDGTDADRQLVFLVVSHEVSHQWFGDLVTMQWWDNLWLNEGFARWMQTHAADALHPEWRTGLQALSIAESGKRADSRPSTHPVLQEIDSPAQAGQAFDNITYDKGATVLGMLSAYMGSDAFRDGIRAYMKAHAYGNTVDSDLWGTMQKVSGKPVLGMEQDFTRNAGLPLVRVTRTQGGVHLDVGRFVIDPANPAPVPADGWRLPLPLMTAGGETTRIVKGSDDFAGPVPLVNAGATAYARVLYDDPSFAAVSAQMASLKPADQMNLLNDAWALGQSDYAHASRVLDLISRLPANADPIVWRRVLDILSGIDAAYGPGPDQDAMHTWARRQLAGVSASIGLAPAANEDGSIQALRGSLQRMLALFGDQGAIDRARTLYASNEGMPAERRAAERIVGATADAATFDAILAKARATNDPLRRSQILRSLAEVRDPALARRFVDVALSSDAPAGSAPGLIGAVGAANPDTVWDAVVAKADAPDFPIDANDAARLMPALASGSGDPARIAQLDAYAEKHIPADARQGVVAAEASIRLNARMQKTAVPDLKAWIAAH